MRGSPLVEACRQCGAPCDRDERDAKGIGPCCSHDEQPKRVLYIRDRDLQKKGLPCFCVELWVADRRLEHHVYNSAQEAQDAADELAKQQSCAVLGAP